MQKEAYYLNVNQNELNYILEMYGYRKSQDNRDVLIKVIEDFLDTTKNFREENKIVRKEFYTWFDIKGEEYGFE